MNTLDAESILNWLLRTSLEASLLILLVLLIRYVLGTRLTPRWRMKLWLLVGLKLFLPACIPVGYGLGSWLPAESSPALIQPSSPTIQNQTTVLSPHPVTQPEGGWQTTTSFSQPAAAVFVWLAGALVVISMALRRQRRFNRLLITRRQGTDPRLKKLISCLSQQTGVRQHVKIILMPPLTPPAMVGLRQPTLLLPEDWETQFDERTLQQVMLHELLHVKKHDVFWNWAALVMQAIHWFNPLVWLAGSRFQMDRELRCDANVLALLTPTEAPSYGHMLLHIQETFFAPPAVAGLAPCVRNHPALLQRITMIAQPTQHRPWLHAAFTVTFGLIACYSFTTVRADEKEPHPPAEREGTRSPEAERDGDRHQKGPRDGDKPKKTGMKDGESTKTGPRDGEQPKTGARDGDKPRQHRDREREAAFTGETLTLRVINQGQHVVIGNEEIPINRLRGYLHEFLPKHVGARVLITGDEGVTEKALHGVMDAVRDNGNKDVRLTNRQK